MRTLILIVATLTMSVFFACESDNTNNGEPCALACGSYCCGASQSAVKAAAIRPARAFTAVGKVAARSTSVPGAVPTIASILL